MTGPIRCECRANRPATLVELRAASSNVTAFARRMAAIGLEPAGIVCWVTVVRVEVSREPVKISLQCKNCWGTRL